MKIKLKMKRVYGRTLYYPVDDNGHMICDLLERKCLRNVHIEKLIFWKWEIEEEKDEKILERK